MGPKRRSRSGGGTRHRPPPFKEAFDFVAHEGMAYAVRHAGYLKARELTIILALTFRKEQDEGRMRPGRDELTVPLIRDMLRALIVGDWKKARPARLPQMQGKAYAEGAKDLGTTPAEMRGQAVGSNWLLRAILAGGDLPDIPQEGISALAERDDDIGLATDFLYLQLSDLEAKRVEHRLADDAAFFEKVWPLVRVNALGLNLYDFIDEQGNLVTPPQAKDEKSPLFAFDAGSWWVDYPVSKKELATMEKIFEELRVKIIGDKATT